ncbi:MAG: PEP-CTERM sorting domain-containing protein, partial [Planctomycetota bacterium]
CGGLLIAASWSAQGQIINPTEDVMTSSFFQGSDQVRGYSGDARPAFRVSSDLAFGVGPETVYIGFDSADFAAISGPVASALLNVESTSGGFFADASAGNPFLVSAHAVDADPFTSITDDTNPGGSISASDFFANNILSSEPEAVTSINSFGTFTFDITSIVNDWLDGTNTVFAIALTGKNDPQTANDGAGFLHGFANNTEAPGSTFIAIPEPASLALLGMGGVCLLTRRRCA